MSAGTASVPAPTTSLIGRRDELAYVLELLDSGPLMVLRGSAGVGKTRLAIAAAEVAGPRYRDGVVWVDLAPTLLQESPGLAVLVTSRKRLDVQGEAAWMVPWAR